MKSLILVAFNIGVFPEETIRSMPKLQKLKLYHCELTEVPAVHLLPELTELNLYGNDLSLVKLNNLSQLTTLEMSYNKIVSIEFENLPKLADLKLARNQLKSL